MTLSAEGTALNCPVAAEPCRCPSASCFQAQNGAPGFRLRWGRCTIRIITTTVRFRFSAVARRQRRSYKNTAGATAQHVPLSYGRSSSDKQCTRIRWNHYWPYIFHCENNSKCILNTFGCCNRVRVSSSDGDSYINNLLEHVKCFHFCHSAAMRIPPKHTSRDSYVLWTWVLQQMPGRKHLALSSRGLNINGLCAVACSFI